MFDLFFVVLYTCDVVCCMFIVFGLFCDSVVWNKVRDTVKSRAVQGRVGYEFGVGLVEYALNCFCVCLRYFVCLCLVCVYLICVFRNCDSEIFFDFFFF